MSVFFLLYVLDFGQVTLVFLNFCFLIGKMVIILFPAWDCCEN